MPKILSKIVTGIRGVISPETQVSDTKTEPLYLSQVERDRRESYLIAKAYYNPSPKGLYQTKVDDTNYLHSLREWSTNALYGNKAYGAEMWGAFNPSTRIVETDVAAQMNEFEPTGIRVWNEGGEVNKDLTQFSHDVFDENGFEAFFQRLFTVSSSQRDGYVRDELDPKMSTKIKLHVLEPSIVFPVFQGYTQIPIAYKIQYDTSLIIDMSVEPSQYEETPNKSFYQLITDRGVATKLDGKFQDDRSYIYNFPELPIVHFPFYRIDDFFGTNSVQGIYEDIDRINTVYTMMWLQAKRMLHPYLIAKNCDISTLPAPGDASKLLKLTDTENMTADISILSFPIDESFFKLLDSAIESMEKKLNHFSIFRSMASMTAGQQDVNRFGVFENGERKIERVQSQNIQNLVNNFLMLSGKTTKRMKVTVEMGSVVGDDPLAILEQIALEFELIGKPGPVMARALNNLRYTETEQEEIKAALKEMAEKEGLNKPGARTQERLQSRIDARDARNQEQEAAQ